MKKNYSPLKWKIGFFLACIITWELLTYNSGGKFQLIPSFSEMIKAFIKGLISGELINHSLFSLYLIGSGLAIGIFCAFLLVVLYMISKPASYILDFIVGIMHPLPGIAMLPLIMILVGIGSNAIILIIVHSILWPIIVNTTAGFRAIPKTQLELGRNLGMSEFKLVYAVMLPNAFPHILSGLKIAWSRSWRALVAAEMVFGATALPEAWDGLFIKKDI